MKRTVLITAALITAALISLATAASAHAAINTYSTTYTFTSRADGAARKPTPISFTDTIKIAPGTAGNRTGVLLNTTNQIYGVTIDGKDFPTCSVDKIAIAHRDSVCPKGARIASGYIHAELGSERNFAETGEACDPGVDIWNAGQGKLTFFLVTSRAHPCLGGALKTGAVPPYLATYKMVGKTLVIDNPVPATVNYPLGKSGGLVGSLQMQHLVWTSHTTTVKGKRMSSIASIACQRHRRPYATTLTATLPPAGPSRERKTLRGSAPC